MNISVQDKLAGIKAGLEDLLGMKIDWYVAPNDLHNLDQQHAILNYTVDSKFADENFHYATVTLDLVLISNEQRTYALMKDKWEAQHAVEIDEHLGTASEWTKDVFIL